MTPEIIAAVVGVIFSFAFELIPGVKDWFERLTAQGKKLVNLAAGFVVVGGAFGLGCAGLIGPYWPCGWGGAWAAFLSFLVYVGANQAAFGLVVNK